MRKQVKVSSFLEQNQDKQQRSNQSHEPKYPTQGAAVPVSKLPVPPVGFRFPFAFSNLKSGLFIKEGIVKHGIFPFRSWFRRTTKTAR